MRARWHACVLSHAAHFIPISVQVQTFIIADSMGRYGVKRVRCKECAHEQDVSNMCENCGITFAEYFCQACKLYATASAQGIFHCDKCGICRVGQGLGISHFHCDTCSACYTLESKPTHKCIERALDSDCPVCMQYLFTSSEALFVGPQCGHALHPACMRQLFRSGTIKCPTCGKPLVGDDVLQDAIANLQHRPRRWFGSLVAVCLLAAGTTGALRLFRYI